MKRHTKTLIALLKEISPTKGVEIGVWKGDTSEGLLISFPDLHLYLIDNYQVSWSSSEIKDDTVKRLSRYNSRLTWLFEESGTAAKHIKDDSLDFVFVDGCHNYEVVKSDIELYLSKIKSGGLIAGHDYHGLYPGVVKAVNEIFSKQVKTSGKRSRIWWVEL